MPNAPVPFLQHGVGCPDGANTMIKTIKYFAEADPSHILVALDSPRAMLNNIEQTDPNLAAVFSRWYTGTTTHRMHLETSHVKISANSGVDQGWSLSVSACDFPVAIDPVRQFVSTELRRLLDDGANLFDQYIWIKPQFFPDALALVTAATRSINLELQPSKIQIWAASCTDPIPHELLEKNRTHTQLL